MSSQNTTLLGKVWDGLSIPAAIGCRLAEIAVCSDSGCLKTIGCSLAARALFVAQTIVSLVSLPILLIATFFTAITTCCGLDKKVFDETKEALTGHFVLIFLNLGWILLPFKCLPEAIAPVPKAMS